jgi:hypothetical protein
VGHMRAMMGQASLEGHCWGRTGELRSKESESTILLSSVHSPQLVDVRRSTFGVDNAFAVGTYLPTRSLNYRTQCKFLVGKVLKIPPEVNHCRFVDTA